MHGLGWGGEAAKRIVIYLIIYDIMQLNLLIVFIKLQHFFLPVLCSRN